MCYGPTARQGQDISVRWGEGLFPLGPLYDQVWMRVRCYPDGPKIPSLTGGMRELGSCLKLYFARGEAITPFPITFWLLKKQREHNLIDRQVYTSLMPFINVFTIEAFSFTSVVNMELRRVAKSRSRFSCLLTKKYSSNSCSKITAMKQVMI